MCICLLRVPVLAHHCTALGWMSISTHWLTAAPSLRWWQAGVAADGCLDRRAPRHHSAPRHDTQPHLTTPSIPDPPNHTKSNISSLASIAACVENSTWLYQSLCSRDGRVKKDKGWAGQKGLGMGGSKRTRDGWVKKDWGWAGQKGLGMGGSKRTRDGWVKKDGAVLKA